MKITKQFEVEMAHYVPNATSYRCSHSTHGHSYKIYLTFHSLFLDNAQMVYDFGLLKGSVKSFIDSMDHCLMMYNGVDDDYIEFFKKHNDRWILTPFIPSAEMMSLYIFNNVKNILDHTNFNNGEKSVMLHSVEVFETRTGSAKCYNEDLNILWNDDWHVEYSQGVMNDWDDDLQKVMKDEMVDNPKIELQVEVPSSIPEEN